MGKAKSYSEKSSKCRPARSISHRFASSIQRRNEFFSLQPSLLNDRDQRTFRQLRVIGHCHNQISLLVPEMNVAAVLAIDLEA